MTPERKRMARVTVQTRSEDSTVQGPTEREMAEVRAIAAEFGVDLKPMHPGIAHPLLSRYFVADLPERARATEFIQRLLQHPYVEAAYMAPTPELP